MTDRLVTRPLTPNCGSEMSAPKVGTLTDAEVDALRTEVSNRCVVVLPKQFAEPSDLAKLAGRLGELLAPGHAPTVDGVLGVVELQNSFNYAHPSYRTDRWHTDSVHMPHPPAMTLLSCEATPLGGDTMWSNQYLAYETLSDEIKNTIRGRKVIYELAEHYRKVLHEHYRKFHDSDAPIEISQPLVRVNPENRRKALYLSFHIPARIDGLSPEQDRSLRDFLFRHSLVPEHVCRHRWSVGDLVIWDNRCSLHYAIRDYDPSAVRTMKRAMVAGELPISEDELPAATRALAS